MNYRPEVDGLRAVAVLPVILFHAGYDIFSGGYVGVDVFFVISGYLITTILLADLERGNFSIRRFYERRARRLLPALFVIMAFSTVLAWFWMLPPRFKDFGQALFAVSFFVSNILFWLKTDYFAASAEESPLLHTWSLAVEEQFYIFFPILLFLLWRFGRNRLFVVVLVLSVASLIWSEWAWRHVPAANFYLIPSRIWELGAGSLCAFTLHNRIRFQNGWLAALGLTMILVAVFVYDETTPFPSLYAVLPVAGAVLIVLYAGPETAAGRLLSLRPVVGVGLISYSSYLWHQPLFAFARIGSETPPGPLMMGLLILATFGLAALTWRYVEQPFRRGPVPVLQGSRAVFSASALGIALFAGIGIAVHLGNGIAGRFTPIQQDYLRTAKNSPLRSTCHSHAARVIWPSDACEFHLKGGTVAVFGDSHTVELSYALGTALEPFGLGVRQYSASACPPSYGSGRDDLCTRWTDATVNHISADLGITHVIVSYRIESALSGDHIGVYPDLPNKVNEARRTEIMVALERALEKLVASGKTVIFVDQSPELPDDILDIISRHAAADHPLQGVSRVWWDARSRYFDEHFETLEGMERLHTEDIFCGDMTCYAGKDGLSFYFDDDHLSVAGASLVAAEIVPKITGRGD